MTQKRQPKKRTVNPKRTSSATLKFAAARAMRAALLAAPFPAVGWSLTGIPSSVGARMFGGFTVIQPATWAGRIVADTFYSQQTFLPGFGNIAPGHRRPGDNVTDGGGQ